MSTTHNLNNLELKAMRLSLGLTIADACDLQSIYITKRFFRYLESGERTINKDINDLFDVLSAQYHLALTNLSDDIDSYNNERHPKTDDADEYFKQLKSTPKLKLPFFQSFELWKEKTGNDLPHFWKIYQAVIGHLLLIDKLTELDDGADIPAQFSIWFWINGKHE